MEAGNTEEQEEQAGLTQAAPPSQPQQQQQPQQVPPQQQPQGKKGNKKQPDNPCIACGKNVTTNSVQCRYPMYPLVPQGLYQPVRRSIQGLGGPGKRGWRGILGLQGLPELRQQGQQAAVGHEQAPGRAREQCGQQHQDHRQQHTGD
jgi:hypothetical protein